MTLARDAEGIRRVEQNVADRAVHEEAAEVEALVDTTHREHQVIQIQNVSTENTRQRVRLTHYENNQSFQVVKKQPAKPVLGPLL